MKLKAVIAVSVLAIAAATGGWMYYRYESAPKNLELYGNVDVRQVNLAFLWPERIKSILVEEGDFVKAGQQRRAFPYTDTGSFRRKRIIHS